MTVIAEDMEVTGIVRVSRCEGLKDSPFQWAPGCGPAEQDRGSVGVQRTRWEVGGFMRNAKEQISLIHSLI